MFQDAIEDEEEQDDEVEEIEEEEKQEVLQFYFGELEDLIRV